MMLKSNSQHTTDNNASKEKVLVKIRGVSKSFPGVKALDAIDFEISSGEVHFLIGENGAGKSTLINILSGTFTPDCGEIIFEDKPVIFYSPKDAQKEKIRTIHQEFMLIPNMSVAENITIGAVSKLFGPVVDWNKTYTTASDILKKLNVNLDIRRKVKDLKASEKQIVDIARALVGDVKLLIMDEPTSALSSSEIKKLFDVIKELKKQGIAIIYISHRLEELSEIADNVTVMRDGKIVGTFIVDKNLDMDILVEKMVGRRIEDQYPHTFQPCGNRSLKTSDLGICGVFENVNIEVHDGEIVGVTGVIGSGMEAIASCLTGVFKPDTGEIIKNNQPVILNSPSDAIKQGIGLIPADRRDMGVVIDFPICHNISLPLIDRLGIGGWINLRKEEKISDNYSRKLNIITPDLYSQTGTLSGGNQQKVVIAKWLAKNVDILVCIEPTRGIDIGTKAEIYKLFHKMVLDGKTVILFSTDYSEIIGMCDRIYAVREGKIVKEYGPGEVTREDLIKKVFGGTGTQSFEGVNQS